MTKKIAEQAAFRHPDPAREPKEVSTREWNAARTFVTDGDSMPVAWETTRQIGGGEAIPWKELLSALFRTKTPEQALRALTREEPWPDLADAEIAFALLAAAQLLDEGEYLHPASYRQKREELLRRDRRRKDGGQLRLPTVDQILTAVEGDWPKACSIAGITAPPEKWRPQRIRRKPKHWDSQEALLSEVLLYVAWLQGKRSSQRKYLAFRQKRPEAPSLQALQDRGGLDALINKAKKPDALQRARKADEAATRTETAEERAARELHERAARPEAQRIIAALRERGVMSGPEISKACGLARTTTRGLLAALAATGAVLRTHQSGAKNLRFYLADLNEEQRADATARRTEELLSSKTGERVWSFFRDGAEATTEQAAAALGLSQSTAREWIRRLQEAGRVERRVVGLPGSGRSYVYHRAPTQA